MNDTKQIGDLIRKARGEHSLRDFTQRCDLSHTHLDSIEKGYDPRTGKPVSLTLETLQKLSKGTGYSVYMLLGEDDLTSIEDHLADAQKKTASDGQPLDEDKQKLLDLTKQMNKEELVDLFNYIEIVKLRRKQ